MRARSNALSIFLGLWPWSPSATWPSSFAASASVNALNCSWLCEFAALCAGEAVSEANKIAADIAIQAIFNFGNLLKLNRLSPLFRKNRVRWVEAPAIRLIVAFASPDAEQSHDPHSFRNVEQGFDLLFIEPFHGGRIVAEDFCHPHHGGQGNHGVAVG